MFSGAESVLRRKATDVMKRMKSARDTLGGIGRMETPWTAGAARTER